MDVQLKSYSMISRIVNYISSLFATILLFSTFSFSQDYLEEAFRDGTRYSSSQLISLRSQDLLFFILDPFCCCSSTILDIFETDTRYITSKVNPATDNFVASLSHLTQSNDIMKKRIVNLKQINGMLSFSDTGVFQAAMEDVSGVSNLSGCIPIDFNNPEDRAKYLEVIDHMEAGGSYTQEGLSSTAFGRYQFMPGTAAQYCGQVSGLQCCGDLWKTGPNNAACQDAMFLLFTAANVKSASSSTPINSCTIYMMHQQGVGGFNWLQGGNSPYSTFARLQLVVSKNVSATAWSEALANGDANSEAGLRNVMNKYWSQKFGGDVNATVGQPSKSLEEFTAGVDDLSKEVEERRQAREQMFRKGILLEYKKENWHIDIMKNGYDLKNSTRTDEIKQELNIDTRKGEGR